MIPRLNRLNCWLVILPVWLAALGASGATSNPASPSEPFDRFKIISERNIFNPARRKPSRPTPAKTTAPAKVDLLTLVGILSYDKGAFAFFDGTNCNFRQVLKPGEAIGGCTVADITPTLVKMKTGGRELDLAVGSQLRRVNEGDWKLIKARRSAPASKTAYGPSRSADSRRSEALTAEAKLSKKRHKRSGRSEPWDGLNPDWRSNED